MATWPRSRPAASPSGSPHGRPWAVLPGLATPVLSLGSRTGELNASTPPIPNASVYSWRVALASAPDAYVLEQQTTAASDTFEGLTPWADLPRRALLDVAV